MTGLEALRLRHRTAALSAAVLCLVVLSGCGSAPVEETPRPTSLAGLPVIASYAFELVEPRQATSEERLDAINTWHEDYDAGLATLDSYGSVAVLNPDGASFRIVRQEWHHKSCSPNPLAAVEVVAEDAMRITYDLPTGPPWDCLGMGHFRADDLDIPPEVTERPIYMELINAAEKPFLLTLRE